MNREIKFGTDGWRGVIADNFTFENVRRIASAFKDYIKNPWTKKHVVIGYDRRFLSKEFALEICKILKTDDIDTTISDKPITTPCLSFTTFSKKVSYGIMITASHNPFYFNGIKFKSSTGSSLSKKETDLIEKFVPSFFRKLTTVIDVKDVLTENFTECYIRKLKSFFYFDRKKLTKLKIAFNPMFGSGAGYLKSCLGDNVNLCEVNSKYDPTFGGINPEPIERFLGDFQKFVLKNNFDVGLAIDGDGDRVGVIDDRGRYLPPHIVFPLLLEYLIKQKKLKGRIVQGFALGYLSRRIAADYGLTLTTVPVGFKFIADEMLKGDCLLGAEESGGFGFGNFIDYIPERDGVLSCLFIIEMLSCGTKKLSEMVDDLQKRYGRSFYDRYDIVVDKVINPDTIYKNINKKFDKTCLKLKLKNIDNLDGLKYTFEDDTWILIRASGTEPVIRIYCESPNRTLPTTLINHIREVTSSILP